ncbi:hypothetical protein HIM_06280 [Hirsutella minnesotensis 3608]|uniref:VOC domain-containing protein n=1 Tax=Hirsutella minnesotensis 3608 TaxID=1043627 RepID=A0A0F8A4W2_9HYPO|nr:hypothetical protein HIM_06280 [Hirsutella minnesotensis 3608]
MPIDHTSISVPRDKLQAHLDFYLATLKPLDYKKTLQFGDSIGLGAPCDADAPGYVKSDFWIVGVDTPAGQPIPTVHLAFTAADHKTVDDFHEAAIKAGAKDNGAPGLRPMYHANYYGAFVIDPSGNNIEAVCHGI